MNAGVFKCKSYHELCVQLQRAGGAASHMKTVMQ